MAISDSEKIDRILKAYVQEVQAWARDDFKYAMARSNMSGERVVEKKTEEKSTKEKRTKEKSAKEKSTKEKSAGEKSTEEQSTGRDRTGEDSAELIFVMRRKPCNFDSLANRITKLTARYRRKYKIALQPAFQWEEENCGEAVEI